MAKLKIKTDDTVVVIAGKDRGKSGRVVRVDPREQKVWVEVGCLDAYSEDAVEGAVAS